MSASDGNILTNNTIQNACACFTRKEVNMRKIMKKRHLHKSQIAVMLLLLLSIIFHPDAGMSSTDASSKTHTLTDGTVITVSNAASDQTVSAETTTVIAAAAAENSEAVRPKAPAFDPAVTKALKKQGLNEGHIGVWQDEHPKSTLNKLGAMTPERQRKIAGVASFIRKVNPKISAKTAWREACALVFYSAKYGIPSELAVSVAKAESKFTPSAKSKAGALGVMQVVWRVHNGMLRAKGIAATRDHMFDPERGVEAGVLILSRYVKAYGTVQKALNRYYGGVAHSYVRTLNKNMAMLQKHNEKAGY